MILPLRPKAFTLQPSPFIHPSFTLSYLLLLLSQHSEDPLKIKTLRGSRGVRKMGCGKRGFSLSGLLTQCAPPTELPTVFRRDENCRHETKRSLHSSLIGEGQLPRNHLVSFLIPTYVLQGRGEKRKIQSLSLYPRTF